MARSGVKVSPYLAQIQPSLAKVDTIAARPARNPWEDHCKGPPQGQREDRCTTRARARIPASSAPPAPPSRRQQTGVRSARRPQACDLGVAGRVRRSLGAGGWVWVGTGGGGGGLATTDRRRCECWTPTL